MAAENGPATSSVIESLRRGAVHYDFFHAVRLLEAQYPDKPRMGEAIRASDDIVRFCQQPSLRFEPSAVIDFVEREGLPPRLFTVFLGLLGPNGPMPLFLTEYVYDREHNSRDFTLSRFLDLFNHRIISLFYRAWAACQQAVSFDRPDRDRFSVYVASLFGLGMSAMRNRDDVPDLAKLHYSGRLACQTHNAEGLEKILEDYLRVRVRIMEFIGQWLELPRECQCRLGQSPDSGMLGSTLIVGSRIWDCQQKFRIRLGPMSLDEYERLLPGGISLRRLIAWVRNYVGDELGFDVQLVLRRQEVPATRLGGKGRLGWSTWLVSRPFERDADDLVLRCA